MCELSKICHLSRSMLNATEDTCDFVADFSS